MTESLTLSKAALVTLLDALLFPLLDDSGELYPPWKREDFTGTALHLTYYDFVGTLHTPESLPSRSSGHPTPWGVAVLARAIITQALTHVYIAEGCAGTDQAVQMKETVRTDIREFVDEVCGTRPPRWPRPWPWPPTLGSARLRPHDLLIVGAQFYKAAAQTNPLQADLTAAADQLFATACERTPSR